MPETVTITDNRTGESVEIPIVDGGVDAKAFAKLMPGTWWITARAWDAGDPNAAWYWNLKVDGDSLALTPANARRLPRY